MADSRGEADFHLATAETPSSGTRSSRSRMASAAECLRRPKGRLAGVIAHSDRLIRINRPEALKAMSGLLQTAYRKDSTLKPQHGELAYLTATTVNNCFY